MNSDHARNIKPVAGDEEQADRHRTAAETEVDPPVVSQAHSPQTRVAQEAHGGSMAPGLADSTGRPLQQPPATRILADEAGSTDD